MWYILGMFLLCWDLTIANMEEMTDICKDVKIGDSVRNPRDCNSYFVCDTVPLIRYCDDGLHFDAFQKVCNWPEKANCQINVMMEQSDGVEVAPPQEIEKAVHLDEMRVVESQPADTHAVPEKSHNFELVHTAPRLQFFALDADLHTPIDPMTGYDPAFVECHYYGAYFLPHPHNCGKYYLCAFGHMLQHKCGPGTGWNYKRQQCELRPVTECYGSATFMAASDDIIWTPEEQIYGKYSACYQYDELTTPETTTSAGWTPSEGTWHPTGSYHTDPERTRTVTASTESTVTSASTGRADTAGTILLECPKNQQAYLPHAEDCSKYYICIVGMPVLTSCPNGLYWDQKAEFCDSAENVKCTVKES